MSTLSVPPYRACLPLILLLAGLVSTPAVQAQQRSNFHRIDVFQEGEACMYRIEGQEDQRLFVMAPLGVVQFRSERGTTIRAEIMDSADGVQGTVGKKDVTVKPDTPVQTLNVRKRRNGEGATDHQVAIACCTSKNIVGQCRWTDAEPAASPEQMGALDASGSDAPRRFFHDAGLPLSRFVLMGGPLDPWRRVGGPIMKVEDD